MELVNLGAKDVLTYRLPPAKGALAALLAQTCSLLQKAHILATRLVCVDVFVFGLA